MSLRPPQGVEATNAAGVKQIKDFFVVDLEIWGKYTVMLRIVRLFCDLNLLE
jgi:hypothetical protein